NRSAWSPPSAAGPVNSPRTNQRGPSTPTNLTSRIPPGSPGPWPGSAGTCAISSIPNDPSVSWLRPPAVSTSAAISARTSSHSPPRRAAANACIWTSLPVPDRHPGTVLLGHDQLDFMFGSDRHLQAAEVHPLEGGEGLLRVPRAALRTRDSRGLLRLVV